MSRENKFYKIMLRKLTISLAMCFAIVFFMQQYCLAQSKTKAELKAELDVLKSEYKSKEAADRRSKSDQLQQPSASGVPSVDDLATNSTKILMSTKSINEQIPDMYKRTIGETIDGVTDVTVKKPTLLELVDLATTITVQIKAVSDASENVKNASEDLKKAKPLQAPKATKGLNYSKDALALTGPELQLSLNIVNNLIATVKSANNN